MLLVSRNPSERSRIAAATLASALPNSISRESTSPGVAMLVEAVAVSDAEDAASEAEAFPHGINMPFVPTVQTVLDGAEIREEEGEVEGEEEEEEEAEEEEWEEEEESEEEESDKENDESLSSRSRAPSPTESQSRSQQVLSAAEEAAEEEAIEENTKKFWTELSEAAELDVSELRAAHEELAALRSRLHAQASQLEGERLQHESEVELLTAAAEEAQELCEKEALMRDEEAEHFALQWEGARAEVRELHLRLEALESQKTELGFAVAAAEDERDAAVERADEVEEYACEAADRADALEDRLAQAERLFVDVNTCTNNSLAPPWPCRTLKLATARTKIKLRKP